MNTFTATENLPVASASEEVVPAELLLEDLEIFLASAANDTLSPSALIHADALQQKFLTSVEGHLATKMGLGYGPADVFVFLKPLLTRL